MKLIVGLGNPGEEYANNRHNAGAMLVDQLAQRVVGGERRVEKTGVFMNESGEAVKKLVDFYFGAKRRNKVLRGRAGSYKVPIENLYIAYDDLDIPLGSYKIVKGKGPRQHNGEESVNRALGTRQYWHVRIGIENRTLDDRSVRKSGKEYVLEDFTEEEKRIIEEVVGRIEEDLRGRLLLNR